MHNDAISHISQELKPNPKLNTECTAAFRIRARAQCRLATVSHVKDKYINNNYDYIITIWPQFHDFSEIDIGAKSVVKTL